MLAQSFVSAAELGITEPQRDALQKVLVLLETGKLVHVELEDDDYADSSVKPTFAGQFNMSRWGHMPVSCGTVACIGGTAELIGGRGLFNDGSYVGGGPLKDLFYPYCLGDDDQWGSITPAQAACALRSYLTTGDAKWAEAVA